MQRFDSSQESIVLFRDIVDSLALAQAPGFGGSSIRAVQGGVGVILIASKR